MRAGFYQKLAWDGIRKNKQMYIPYFFTGGIMVMMFYILCSLTESPSLEMMRGGVILMELLPLGCSIIGFFSLLFLFYSNSFLIRQRYREFGLYNILGMDKRNISRVMLFEAVDTALISIASGIAAGILFSKAAELVLLNILNQKISYAMHIGRKAIWITGLVYAAVFFVLLVNSLIRIYWSKPLELMQSNRVGEKKIKCNWLFAIVGIVLLAWAYYLAVSIEEPATALLIFVIAVFMVITGTYLLFISGSVAFCRILQKNKRYYYKPNHFVSVSSMTYRMKRNGAGLASICILLTMVLVMLSSTASLYFGEEDSLKKRYPNNINVGVTYQDISSKQEGLAVLREKIAKCVPEGTNLTGTQYAVAAGMFTKDGIMLEQTHADSIDYDKIGYVYILSLEDYNAKMGTDKSLGNGECLLYCDRLENQWDTFSMEYCSTYKVKERLKEFKQMGITMVSTTPSIYLVVNDLEEFTKPIQGKKNDNGYFMLEYQWLLGFDCEKEKEPIIKEKIETCISKTGIYWEYFYVESREEEKSAFYEIYGSLFFLGLMLSFVFLIAAVLIIYYKQLSEGYEDQNRFEIMQKVGMTKPEIRKSINSQILTVFFLPLVLAGIHLVFAFPFLSKILLLFAFENTLLNVAVTVCCFCIFGVFYGVVYKITSGCYYKIVSGKRE